MDSTVILSGLVMILVTAAITYTLVHAMCNTMPVIDPDKPGASVLVLGCMDPRFANALAWHLSHSEELHADYDLFTLAGASLGVLQETYPHWSIAFEDHVDLAIKHHDIQEIWAFDHMDCDMYKTTLGLPADDDEAIHVETLEELKVFLKARYPALSFRGHIIGTDSSITRVL